MDAIAAYRAASEANDIDGLVATLAPNAEVVSPLAAHFVFRGNDDLRLLLGAVYGTITGLRWEEEISQGSKAVLVGGGCVGPLRVDDAMVFELAEDGRIRRIRPHLRPWLATTFFALRLGVKIARHPGVVWRAMRRASDAPAV